jgi:hypothetical protein
VPNRSYQLQSLSLPNAYVERIIGSIRRECLDHVIVCGAGGLHCILTDYVVTDCDSGFVHGPGGGAGLVDSGTFLHDIVPSANLKGLIVALTEPPTSGHTLAHFTCAT